MVKKSAIAIFVSPAERRMVERCMKARGLTLGAQYLRQLINEDHQKILQKNVATATKSEEGKEQG